VKIAFVRIPKNASRSIKATNLFICGRHETIAQMKELYEFDKSFCVCRNPYSRFVSAYHNGHTQWSGRKWPYFDQFKHYETFDSFCRNRKNPFLHGRVTRMGKNYEAKSHVRHPHFIPQYQWVTINDKLVVNNILRMEKLVYWWNKLLRDYKIEHVPLEKINASHHDDWKDYYDESLAKVVFQYYKRDFIMFGYSKDSWRK